MKINKDDLSVLAQGFFETGSEAFKNFKNFIHSTQFDEELQQKYVTREEYEVLKLQLEKLSSEIENLKK